MASHGHVREWHADDGWGFIDSEVTPGGCWAHYSSVVMDGYRSLSISQAVTFTFEPAGQDGYSWRAVAVWPDGVLRGAEQQAEGGPSAAYGSTRRLDHDGEEDPRPHG